MTQTLSVAQFIEFLNAALATAVFPEGAVIEGEVAEYKVSQGKWIWFLLKDEQAVVSCFSTVWQLRTPLEDGMRVRVHGTPKVHPKSGKFSVNVDRVEPVGEGALRRAFELLKKRFAEEGLFAPERKRPLPRFPERIGLITSSEAAAYTDFLRILGNRWSGAEVLLADVSVQGRDAVRSIVGAFRWFNARPDSADVIVLTRGGGSLEDLQAFNAEEVVRAVYGSRIPVVVGVGHERDETLADLAADVRASTPSNAAEIVAPDRREIAARVDAAAAAMESALRAEVLAARHAVASAAMRLETHALRGAAALDALVAGLGRRLDAFAARTSAARERTIGAAARLASAGAAWSAALARRVATNARLLASHDPGRPLQRGYALVRGADGALVTDAASLDIGALVDVQLRTGGFVGEVKEKKNER